MALGAAGLFLLLPVRPTVEMARDYEECVDAIAAGASTQGKRPASDAQRDSMTDVARVLRVGANQAGATPTSILCRIATSILPAPIQRPRSVA